uniref:Uncharacterized protein n=1 Tax=Phasianus colchicus TaxID=9054 RepID=A0A669PVW2_PHACC
MLAQLTVLLALGVLCSPAPTSTPSHCSTVYSIIEEVQSDESSSIPRDIEDKKCMRDNLKTFIESLKANHVENRKVVYQLSIVHKCEHLFVKVISPQVSLEKECKTAEVSEDKFVQLFSGFLNNLSESLLRT